MDVESLLQVHRSFVLVACSASFLCGTPAAQEERKVPAKAAPYIDPDVKVDAPAPRIPKPTDPPRMLAGATGPSPAPVVGSPAPEALCRERSLAGKAPTVGKLDPDEVHFSGGSDGTLWGGSLRYKAAFDRKGVRFIPYLGADAPRSWPLGLTLRDIRVGGQPMPLAVEPVVNQAGARVTIDRGAASEVYDLSGTGMEQSFVVKAPPGVGELSVRIDVATELTFRATADGFRFGNERGWVTYGEAFVRDAAGARAAITSRFDDQTIELRVPAAFLAAATFPVTIDPLVTTFTASAASAVDFNPDVAYDLLTNSYCVVWEHIFSALDHDIGSQTHRSDGILIQGSFQWIDQTTDNWVAPKVANLRLPPRFLAVAQRGVAPNRAIWGQTRNAVSPYAMGGQFDISGPAGGSGEKLRPDVGGDPSPTAPSFWTVVWQRNFSGTDSDVHAQQVNADSTLRNGLILVDNSGATLDANPSISKSDGNGRFASQHWIVVWQRQVNATDNDIRFARITWDGVLTTGSSSLDFTSHNDIHPAVSSPTDDVGGSRFWLACYEREQGSGHLITVALARNATILSRQDLHQLEQVLPIADCLLPSVDSDGTRFVVAYAEHFNGSLGNLDIRASTLHVAFGSTLGLSEGRVGLGISTRDEFRPRITARHSGGATGVGYCAVYEDEFSATDTDVRGVIYDGAQPGEPFHGLATGCDGLGLSASGSTRLGDTARFTLTNVGSNVPFLMLGLPFGPLTVCATCGLGVDLGTATFFAQSTLDVPIQRRGELVGATLAVQGLTFGTGPCNAQLRLSDTVDFTIR